METHENGSRSKFFGPLEPFLLLAKQICLDYLDHGIRVTVGDLAEVYQGLVDKEFKCDKTFGNHLKEGISSDYSPKLLRTDCQVVYCFVHYAQGASLSRVLKKNSIGWNEKKFAELFRASYGADYSRFDPEPVIAQINAKTPILKRFRLLLLDQTMSL